MSYGLNVEMHKQVRSKNTIFLLSLVYMLSPSGEGVGGKLCISDER